MKYCSGKREVTKVKLYQKKWLIRMISEMLEDLIMAATNEALRQLEEFSSDSMSKITGHGWSWRTSVLGKKA